MRNHRNHRNRRNKFRSRSNDRIFRRKPEGLSSNNINYISNGIQRQSFGNNNHNAPKLLEKYNNLAREALANEDKILSESYFQYADHFTRVLSEREKNQSIKEIKNSDVNKFPVSSEEKNKINLEKNKELDEKNSSS